MPLHTTGKFDFWATFYTLTGYRSDFTLEFYNESDEYLGYLVSRKDLNTWIRGDYSTFSFYGAYDNHILEIHANFFAGGRYGNGSVGGSLDFSDRSKIKLFPKSYSYSTHYHYTDRIFEVNHPFASMAKIKLVYVY